MAIEHPAGVVQVVEQQRRIADPPFARALDLGARRGTRLESVPDAIVDEVLAQLTPIFE